MTFTDHPGILEAARQRWDPGDHQSVDFAQVEHIKSGAVSSDGLSRIALDIELMAGCDVLVVTGMSNFALPAIWMRDRDAYAIDGDYDTLAATSLRDPIAAPGCFRMGSIDALGKRMFPYRLDGLEIPPLRCHSGAQREENGR
jgi:hypothetical protein